jgi:Domain of unknown function (DUF5925)/ATPase family associated with various cellular activities (AAA)
MKAPVGLSQVTYPDGGSLTGAAYVDEAIRRGYTHEARVAWRTDATEPLLDALYESHTGPRTDYYLLVVGAAVVYVQIDAGSVWAYATGDTLIAAKAAIEEVRQRIPVAADASSDEIAVRFWYHTDHEPQSRSRRISAPQWDTIVGNYTERARLGLGALMNGFTPSHGGQIILWHGPAGTGKTYALRALCSAWRKWCTAEYIVDPERFFGEADYLMPMILANEGRAIADDDDDEDEEDPAQKWRLLIMEDTGELIREDAKEVTHQGLSRLLNVTDGFIGQGLRVLVLITTNEHVGRLHPAVSRPGRAASIVNFDRLSAHEADEWARAHGIPEPRTHQSIAELYAVAEQFAVQPKHERPIGFEVDG